MNRMPDACRGWIASLIVLCACGGSPTDRREQLASFLRSSTTGGAKSAAPAAYADPPPPAPPPSATEAEPGRPKAHETAPAAATEPAANERAAAGRASQPTAEESPKPPAESPPPSAPPATQREAVGHASQPPPKEQPQPGAVQPPSAVPPAPGREASRWPSPDSEDRSVAAAPGEEDTEPILGRVLIGAPLPGPFPDPDGVCRDIERELKTQDLDPVLTMTCEARWDLFRPRSDAVSLINPEPDDAPSPLVLVVEGAGEGFEFTNRYLALRYRGRWYRGPILTFLPQRIGEEPPIMTFEYRDIVPRGSKELVLTVRHETHDVLMGLNSDIVTIEATMFVCGVGTSGRPSCTKIPSIARWSCTRPNDPNYPMEDTPKPWSGWSYAYSFEPLVVRLRLHEARNLDKELREERTVGPFWFP